MNGRRFAGVVIPWVGALVATAGVTAVAHSMRLSANTTGFAFLIVVLISSMHGGLLVGAVASVAATLCYNYFFFPPLYTFTIHDPANWMALAAFLLTSVVVSRLVIAARIQAQRAEQRHTELQLLIEEHAHVEALRESETLKTSLLRAISHDLTTPLTAITLHTEELRRRAAGDEEMIVPVAGIAGETARLRRRIDNLLAMARLEAGKSKPRREPTPPADLFRAVRENLPLMFESRPITVHVDDDCPDANVDPALALEILVNLIENAHRVSPPNAPLELTARIHPDDPGLVRIEILDRGPGVPAGLADRHGNLAGAASDVAQRGLGLEIARSLATANGGSIGIVPRAGGGAVARLDVVSAPLPQLALPEAG
jgi:K+-sensing histidine kinase KdpD